MKLSVPSILLASLLLVGCVKEPEGPAERIGRGIDDIMKGLEEMDAQSSSRGRYDDEADQRTRKNPQPERETAPSKPSHYSEQTAL